MSLPPLDTAGLTIFIVILFIGLYANIFGLPGTVLIFLDALVYALITGFSDMGWQLLVSLLVIAIFAEGLEFILGVTGAARFSVSKKVLAVSVFGSIVGALILTPWLYGLGILTGIFLGGFTGALLMELVRQLHLKPALRDSNGALLGRAAGTLVKGGMTMVMVVMALMNIYS